MTTQNTGRILLTVKNVSLSSNQLKNSINKCIERNILIKFTAQRILNQVCEGEL